MISITAAALKTNNKVYTGQRHFNCVSAWWNELGHPEKYTLEMQGFVTSEGQFVSREEAARIALQAGQITEIPKATLLSEDLW